MNVRQPSSDTVVLESPKQASDSFVRRFVVRPFEYLNTITALVVLLGLLTVLIPVGYVAVWSDPHTPPMEYWNALFRRAFRFYFWMAGVKVVVRGVKQFPRNVPTLFAANHQGIFDGPLFDLALEHRSVVGLTAPYKYFPWPISFWFSKIGGIDVARSPEEAKKYPTANSPKQAVELMVRELGRNKRSGIIFPEGHVERTPRPMEFQTGAVRIALLAGVSLVPVTIHGTRHTFMPGRLLFLPGTITVTFHSVNSLPSDPTLAERKALVEHWTIQLEHKIVHGLPTHYEQDLPDCDCRTTFSPVKALTKRAATKKRGSASPSSRR